jgi:hypothetical protein
MFHVKALREFERREEDFAVPEDFADFNAASIIPPVLSHQNFPETKIYGRRQVSIFGLTKALVPPLPIPMTWV